MDQLRPLLTTYAYNILGSLEESKDVVQDAYLKFMAVDADKIENKKAYLVRTVINLSINAKNRQQKLVAEYTGPWLPEPVATENADAGINQKEILSYSLMVLMEKLNTRQRAVFILKEAFDYEHDEIAEVLDISVENSRKLLSRAKEQLQKGTPVAHKPVKKEEVNKYLTIIQKGDTRLLEQLLHNEISLISDGGGKATAATKELQGIHDVASFLIGVFKKFYSYAHIRTEIKSINNEPALCYYADDQLVTAVMMVMNGDHIENLYFMRNPDKLAAISK
jgi:RNA polymerase sigma-70 factor (ECF subfamily)